MTKVIYHTAATLDGFIADQSNSLDWLFEVPHEEDEDGGAWEALMARTGALVMGATTYTWMLDQEPRLLTDRGQWQEWYGDRPAWVFTHRTDLPVVLGAQLRFVSGDVRPVHDEIAAALPGKDIWVVGGGDLVGQFDDAGLLDEVHVNLTPVVLGSGAPLLPRRITSSRMRFRECTRSGQRVNVVLDVDRPRSL